MKKAQIMARSIRINEANPNHHLWNNHGTWWCHFTVHHPDHTAERRRLSLGTDQVEVARFLRDSLLHLPGEFAESAGN